MKSRLRRWIALASAVAATAVLWACNTPYIPVPPPGAPSFQSMLVDDGMGGKHKVWEPHGGPLSTAADGRYYIFNRATGTGVIAKAMPDGSYVGSPIDGMDGDGVEVFYRTTKGELSGTTCTMLAEGQTPAVNCPP